MVIEQSSQGGYYIFVIFLHISKNMIIVFVSKPVFFRCLFHFISDIRNIIIYFSGGNGS